MSFPPTFAFRPLTPPYVPFGIRRFLIFGAFGHSSPLDMGILPCEGWHWMQPISLLGSWLLTNTLCSHFPTYRPSVVRYRTFEGSLPVYKSLHPSKPFGFQPISLKVVYGSCRSFLLSFFHKVPFYTLVSIKFGPSLSCRY